jgi:Ca-activated chloride channel family protein
MRLIGLILLIGFTRIIRSLSVKSAPSLLFGPNRIHYARSLRVNVRLASVALCLTLCAARAQEPPPAPQEPIQTLKLSTRIVGVSAVVLDNRGEPVRGLAKEDFTLKEDGKEQEIRYFSQDSDLPLTLVLMVDTSGSQKMFIQDETDASAKFFRAMLTRPQDRAALVQFDYNVLQLQQMTNRLDALENSLGFLSMPHAAPGGRPLPAGGGGTLLYDAIIASSQVELTKERGRRAMVILTDGGDHGSRFDLQQAIAAAQRSDAVVYSVFYSAQAFASGVQRTPMTPGWVDGRQVLDQISSATGGHVFTVSQRMPLDLIFTQIADDMRMQYQIGYTPPESAPGSYHKIELKPKAKHLSVRARVGYYTPK